MRQSYTLNYLDPLPSMFFVQNPPLENPAPLFNMNYGFESSIDFCVWVLERDGLHASPFDRHSAGDGVLQSSGMTAEQWRSWITRTVLLLDQRLHWEVPSLETENQQLDDLLGTDFPSLDSPSFLDQITQYDMWQQEQFENIKAVVKALYGDRTPPDPWGHNEIAVWDGVPAVADRLRELREVYPSQQREQVWLSFPAGSVTGEDGRTNGIADWVEPYQEALGYLELHLVAYPHPVALPISPNAIVLSPSANPRDSETLKARLLEAIEQLLINNA